MHGGRASKIGTRRSHGGTLSNTVQEHTVRQRPCSAGGFSKTIGEVRQQPQKLSTVCCVLHSAIRQRVGNSSSVLPIWLRTQFVKEACVRLSGRHHCRAARRGSCLRPCSHSYSTILIGISNTKLCNHTLLCGRYRLSPRKCAVTKSAGWPHSVSALHQGGIARSWSTTYLQH